MEQYILDCEGHKYMKLTTNPHKNPNSTIPEPYHVLRSMLHCQVVHATLGHHFQSNVPYGSWINIF